MTAADRSVRLRVIADVVASCTSCALAATRKKTVFGRGNPFAPIVLLGEAPGADEDERGEPFVGATGKELESLLRAAGFAPGEAYLMNVIKCRPPGNRRPLPDEVEACRRHLDAQLAVVQPRIIVALGGTAIQAVLGTKTPTTKIRGEWHMREDVAVMPTFHPAYLFHKRSAKPDVVADLRAARARALKGAAQETRTSDDAGV
jgi:uracil-DNA glycosylase family 4